MKKALILNYELPPLGGGGGVAAFTIAKGLIKKGYEVDYVTSGFGNLPKREVLHGINVYRVKVIGRKHVQTATPISLISFPFMALWRTFQLCRKNKYDFMHTHFVVPTGLLALIFSKLYGIKNFIFIHGGDIYDPTRQNSSHRNPILRKIIRFLLNQADVVVAQSIDIRDHCVRFYRPRTTVQVVPLPYIPKRFNQVSRSQLGMWNDKKYIVGIGRLIKRKDFETFILAISRLDKSIEGIIIGQGPEHHNLTQTADAAGVGDRIHLVGQVGEEKKFQYLSNADLFLLTSVHEGFGIVIQEAMQVGLPVVVTNNGGQKDFIEDGKNGFFGKVGDVESIVESIQRLLNNKELATVMAKNNRQKIKEFKLDAICTRYLDLYAALPNKRTKNMQVQTVMSVAETAHS